MLAIMRDSRLGTYGGLALIFVLLAKFWWSANWRYVERQCWRRWQWPVRLARQRCFIDVRHGPVKRGLAMYFIGKVSGRQNLYYSGIS
ncbi:adenosylcobinamide-GDP ribazoletransferase [Salmonella enterica subsp. enterica]|nr:adenosylcobinamide-GDP ribazoletransferase [Salmonella enterica subsp. enterica]